jgi:hypothetical protein
MPTFLFSALNSDGASVTERIDAASVSAARYRLELRGYKNLVFHIDDMAARYEATLADEFPSIDPDNPLTPAQEQEARRGGGILQTIWLIWKLNALFWMPLVLWNGLSLYQGRPFGWGDLTGFVFSGLFLLYFFWMVLPGIAYQKLLEAGVYYRFAEVRRWANFIRIIKRFGLVPIPEFELDFRVAYGLAADGKLAEALEMTKKYENHSCGKFQYYSRLSGLYAGARDYEKMTELNKLAAEHGMGKPEEKLDVALGLLRRERKPNEAKPILDEIDLSDCGDLVAIFYEYCRGLLAVELEEWDAAEQSLQKAIDLSKVYESNPLMAGMIKDIQAYLSLALAYTGKMKEAKALFRDAEPLLRIRREDDLLSRCRAALSLPDVPVRS